MNEGIREIISCLERSPAIVKHFVGSIPEEHYHIIRKEGLWSIHHHVCHLAEVQVMLYERLVRFRKEDNPLFVPYFPPEGRDEEYRHTPISRALDNFERWRSKQLEVIAGFQQPDWRKEGRHPEYIAYNPEILVRHILMHDHWHMYRMEELWLTTEEYLESL